MLTSGTRRPAPGLVIGGSPWRLLRVTPAGDRLLDRWAAGQPLGIDPGARRLAGRLVDSGMAAVAPGPGSSPGPSVAVVIPVRDRAEGLAATLATLDAGYPLVVVDDGSLDPVATPGPETQVIRRPKPGGPAAARNDGWRSLDSEVVAFVDADCITPPGWLESLAGHFADPEVGAVAPRIVPLPGPSGMVSAYEACHSPLDLGAVAATVRPFAPLTYVPSTALVVRRAALEATGGFDEALRTGEDVDLVWRLCRAGWRVRYDPSVEVGHPVRDSVAALARQRYGYGRSSAPLAERHGPAVAPLVADPVSVAAWTLAALGFPAAGAALAAGASSAAVEPLRRRRPAVLAPEEIARVVLAGQSSVGRGMLVAARRTWWPLLAAGALASGRARRPALAVLLGPPLAEWRRLRPAVSPLRWCAMAALDDAAYGAGVWAGALRARRGRCLLPVGPRRAATPASPPAAARGSGAPAPAPLP